MEILYSVNLGTSLSVPITVGGLGREGRKGGRGGGGGNEEGGEVLIMLLGMSSFQGV